MFWLISHTQMSGFTTAWASSGSTVQVRTQYPMSTERAGLHQVDQRLPTLHMLSTEHAVVDVGKSSGITITALMTRELLSTFHRGDKFTLVADART